MRSAAMTEAPERPPADLEQAFNELVRAQAAPLLGYVSRHTGRDRWLAEDIVQETLLRTWLHPTILTDTGRSPRPWLCTVALNVLRDRKRAVNARPTEVEEGTALLNTPDPSDAHANALDSHLMVAALGRLSSQHREILFEVYYRGATVAEAAAAVGIPVGTAKSRIYYALKALRLGLAELGLDRPPAPGSSGRSSATGSRSSPAAGATPGRFTPR